ncbi:DUF4192 domain-containing protein [Nocardia sp. NBC_01327]|uniref:DUF4192 domain-containing protein n=1 Tax=Nocardia sp. NBC_01327 TaxID=2903593 RepID=UPI002E109136|nr:DUF4192 domain-containing protein [Nocardia sp. NBC_01327]
MPSEPHITEPGDLIAAIPAMLGFTPERSLVVVTLKQRGAEQPEVDMAIRVDLHDCGEPPDTDIVRRIAEACSRADIVAALAVIVDDRLAIPSACSVTDRSGDRLLATLEQHLIKVGVRLAGAWAVAGVLADAPWWNLRDPRQRGTLPDPTASRIAAERVLASLPILGCREELFGLVAVDESLREQVAAVLPQMIAEAQRRLACDVCIGNPDAYSRKALWRVMEVLKQSGNPQQVSPVDLAEVATALCDTTVRDCMFGVAHGTYRVAAEQLWMLSTRALPDRHRAEAATLLAFCAYLRGDGPLAGVALETALAADPGHRMAELLDVALQVGLPPAKLHKLVRCGIETAAELRIDIGVAQHDTQIQVAP